GSDATTCDAEIPAPDKAVLIACPTRSRFPARSSHAPSGSAAIPRFSTRTDAPVVSISTTLTDESPNSTAAERVWPDCRPSLPSDNGSSQLIEVWRGHPIGPTWPALNFLKLIQNGRLQRGRVC